MHLKNWSLIYPDGRNAALAPAYDFGSTVACIPDDRMALNYARSKKFAEFTTDELRYLAAKARLPEILVVDTARETVSRFHTAWRERRNDLSLDKKKLAAIETHITRLPLASEK